MISNIVMCSFGFTTTSFGNPSVSATVSVCGACMNVVRVTSLSMVCAYAPCPGENNCVRVCICALPVRQYMVVGL